MSNPLLKKIDQDTLVLTVNRRLARTLTQQFDQQQIASGALVWPTPSILPLPTWLEQCWDQLLVKIEQGASTEPIQTLSLLTPWQERLLWENIISESSSGATLLRVSEAAQNAQNAWKLLQEWQTTLTDADLYDHPDAQAFHLWSNQVVERCQQKNWLDHARLGTYLLQNLQQLALPKHILLAGFQRKSPRHNAFFSSLANAGVNVAELSFSALSLSTNNTSCNPGPLPKQDTDTRVRIALASVEAEILAAAQWSRTLLTVDASKKIGIVAPALEAMLPKVVEIFSRIFYPGQNPTSINPGTNVFNISLGNRLTETPLVRDALLLLELGKTELSLEQYTALLHSPFWHGGLSEWSKRSLLDSRLRKNSILRISTTSLHYEATRGNKESPPCPLLAATLAQFITTLQADADKKTQNRQTQSKKPSTWITDFSQWLAVLGWPGERSLSSGEYQTVAAWQKALASFSSLDKILGPIAVAPALTHLKRMLAEISFQPESGHAPIQILGLLESVGESYDHLWIMGLCEDVWPAPLEPNPFLPIALQRRLGMPKASFDLEITYDNMLFDELMTVAEQVIVSYPNQNGDQLLRPSPLILAIPQWAPTGSYATTAASTLENQHLAEALEFSLFPEYNRIIFAASQITSHVDDHGPEFKVENMVGTGVLKSQALCPFQAFARFRLGARSQQEPDMGLDPPQRGEIVHSALTQLWKNIGDSQTDLQTVCTAPEPWVHTSVQETLKKKLQEWPDALHPFFRQLEEARLKRLLHTFLGVEKKRVTPFTVIEQELVGQLPLGDLTVRMRMDRVDRLQDGSLVILDYKTGQAKEADWFGERPADPQMPLYALVMARQKPIAALAFYQVRATGCGFRGLTNQKGVLPGVADFNSSKLTAEFVDWLALQEYWREILTSLGNAFVKGDAKIDPLKKANPCNYCDLHPLCRRNESFNSVEEVEES